MFEDVDEGSPCLRAMDIAGWAERHDIDNKQDHENQNRARRCASIPNGFWDRSKTVAHKSHSRIVENILRL